MEPWRIEGIEESQYSLLKVFVNADTWRSTELYGFSGIR